MSDSNFVYGWTCANCGAFVKFDQSHSCIASELFEVKDWSQECYQELIKVNEKLTRLIELLENTYFFAKD